MSTSSVNGTQTSVAASGQASGTSSKGSALFGTPQASGDFLAMLMGAFGQMAPVATSSVTGVTNGSPIGSSTADILMTPAIEGGVLNQIPVIDTALESSQESVGIANETFTEFLESTLENARKQDHVITGLSKEENSQKTGLPNGEWVSKNGAGGQAVANFGDRLTSQNGSQVLDSRSGLMGTDPSGSIIPTVTSSDDPTQDLAIQLNAMIVGGSENKAHKDGSMRGNASSLGVLSGLLTPANDAGYTPSFLAAQDGYQLPVQSSSITTMSNAMAEIDLDTININDPGGLSNLDPSMDLSFDSTMTSDRSASAQTTTTSTQGADRNGTHTVTSSHNMVQAVSVHLQSMALNRDTRSLTLHLDPPELGKLQIKMSYGRDKSVRADVLIEKPDTLRLMEQDSTTLKSALDNAGLQTDAGSLNFSLADQGSFQNSESQAFLGNIKNHQDDQAIGIDDIAGFEFKSTEEWSVDPSTGITRYNIVV